MRWHVRRAKAMRGDIAEEDDSWDVLDPQRAWSMWTLLESVEWKHLPDAGGLLDQSEALLLDLSTITYQSTVIEQEVKDELSPDG